MNQKRTGVPWHLESWEVRSEVNLEARRNRGHHALMDVWVGGQKVKKPLAKSVELFWRNIDKHGPRYRTLGNCWIWKYGKHNMGYGVCHILGQQYAHRAAWLLSGNSIPDGLHVLHKCDNPPCCNPNHLWLGTNLDNIRDMISKGRHVCGEGVRTAKFTAEDILGIRHSYRTGEGWVSIEHLAHFTGVSEHCITDIIYGKTWKHLLKR